MRRAARRSEESGYVAVLTSVMFATLFFALAATAVDTANWYVEVQRVQKAADAASLGGVVYMPQDFARATRTAKEITVRNGYDDTDQDIAVTTAPGESPSQLEVTVSSRVRNTFGSLIGLSETTITRTAVADFTGPAPMGSPCNTFGNEPSGGGGSSAAVPIGTAAGASPYVNCVRNSQFWAQIAGPETGKVQGDRFSTVNCENANVDECDAGRNNEEFKEEGYFFLVRVGEQAVGRDIKLQLFDPAFVVTGPQCDSLPTTDKFAASTASSPYNDFVSTDQAARYGRDSDKTLPSQCPGDTFPGTGSGQSTKHKMVTTFVLREQTDTLDPTKAAVSTGTNGQKCIKQYDATTTAPTESSLKKSSSSYSASLAKVFHNWVDFCTFRPNRSGDYYIQVRSNVPFGGTQESNTNSRPRLISSGNSAAEAVKGTSEYGEGANSFAMRAVIPGYEKQVSISGYDRMPVYQNGVGSSAVFNLIQVLPGARGYSINFSFFDAGDASASGSIEVIPPDDATGSIRWAKFPGGCRAVGGYAGAAGQTLSDCKATITNSKNNGKIETITIPIPDDYDCNFASSGGCWYRVRVTFSSGDVHDTTTWTAGIVNDPVRLLR